MERVKQAFAWLLAAKHIDMIREAYSNSRLDVVPAVFWDAVEVLLTLHRNAKPPKGMEQFGDAVASMADAVAQYDERDIVTPEQDPTIAAALWAACRQLREAGERIRDAKQRFRESPEELKKQGCDVQQICRIWQLRDASGNWDVRRMQEELDKPGSVINDDYQHPDDPPTFAFSAAQFAMLRHPPLRGVPETLGELPAPVGEDATATPEAMAEAVRPPAKETPYDLWQHDRTAETPIGIDQAAKMLRMDVADLRSSWEFFSQGGTFEQWQEAQQIEQVDTPETVEPPEAVTTLDQLTDSQVKTLAKQQGIETRGRNVNQLRAILEEQLAS